ncbi:MAG: TIGR03943 family protein [Desulfobacterales bacterium]|nr:TIGR03943 family protein [Desulfobacterales bacterium]
MAVRSYLPLLVMAAWSGALVWLLLDDNYQLFLKPTFKGLITASLIICTILCISLVKDILSRDQQVKPSLIKGLILLLPIGFIFMAGENTLGEYTLRKRSLAAPVLQKDDKIIPQTITTTEGKQNISISTLIRQYDQFNGKTVQVEGLFAKTVVEHDELSAVFRYFITCCAADAQPVGVFMDSNPDLAIDNNDWVKVSGKVRKVILDGYEVIFMDVDAIEAAEKPGKNAAYIFN